MAKILDDRVLSPGWGPDTFGWSRRRVNGAELISLAGELDLAAAPALSLRLMSLAESSDTTLIVLDLSQVRFMDARCAGIILAASEAAQGRGAQLQVEGLHGVPELVFEVLGLAPLLGRRAEPHDSGRDPGD